MNIALGALAATQLLAGLALQLLILRIVGAGPLTDAFVAAQAVPMLVSALLGMLLQAIWQPRLSVAAVDMATWRTEQGVAHGQILLYAPAISILALLTAPLWLPRLFSEFSAEQLALVQRMSVPLFLAAVFNIQIAMLLTAQRARGAFYRSELYSLIGTLLALLLLAACLPRMGIESAAWIFLLRSLLVAAALYLLADRPLPMLLGARDAKGIWAPMRSMMTGAALQKSNPLVERYWSAQGASPGVTLLNLAQTAITALASVLEKAICGPTAPHIARAIAAHDYRVALALYRHGIMQVMGLVAALVLVLILLQPLWDDLLAQLLRLETAHATQLWWFCLLLLGYLLSGAAGPIAVAVFYALGDTSTPARVSAAGFFAGLILKSIGFLWQGLPGLAAAISLGHLLNLAALCILVEKTLHRHPPHES